MEKSKKFLIKDILEFVFSVLVFAVITFTLDYLSYSSGSLIKNALVFVATGIIVYYVEEKLGKLSNYYKKHSDSVKVIKNKLIASKVFFIVGILVIYIDDIHLKQLLFNMLLMNIFYDRRKYTELHTLYNIKDVAMAVNENGIHYSCEDFIKLLREKPFTYYVLRYNDYIFSIGTANYFNPLKFSRKKEYYTYETNIKVNDLNNLNLNAVKWKLFSTQDIDEMKKHPIYDGKNLETMWSDLCIMLVEPSHLQYIVFPKFLRKGKSTANI